MKPQDKVFMVVGSTAFLIAAGFTGVWLFGKQDAVPETAQQSQSTTSTQPATDTSSNVATTSTSSSTYIDGTYAASINYAAPHGHTNVVKASVTINSDAITAVTLTHEYDDRESKTYLDSFDQAITAAVVGKSIADLELSRIGGASLTTQAFEDALTTIRSNAKT